jgi:hypothetical protein
MVVPYILCQNNECGWNLSAPSIYNKKNRYDFIVDRMVCSLKFGDFNLHT